MKNAFSIIELLVVMSVIAILVVIAIPAMNAMQKSFDSGGAESMISTALATARTLAIKNNHYAGVRFQKACDPANVLKAAQYMIFIVYNSDSQITNWVCGFIAVEGYKPIKLPENVSMIDMIRRRERTSRTCNDPTPYHEDRLAETDLGNDIAVNITDTSTFSILFSPAGKLVTQEVRCRGNQSINDIVFNDPPTGMFLEDNHDDIGIGVENSRREFWIYDRQKFEKMTTASQRWNYLNGLTALRINPYTGEIIK